MVHGGMAYAQVCFDFLYKCLQDCSVLLPFGDVMMYSTLLNLDTPLACHGQSM